MNSNRFDNLTLLGSLQRLVNGDDADAIIDHVLVKMTRRPDAPSLFPDNRARRRIENRLRHTAASYARLLATVFDVFREAAEAEGLSVSPEFASDCDVVHVPLEKILERASQPA